MSTVRVALAQLSLTALNVDDNVERTVDAIDEAADAGADIVVLPELANSGYVLDSAALTSVAEDVTRPGRALQAWSGLARSRRVVVVGGFAERVGDRLFNSAVVFRPDGRLVLHYRKLHLFAGEGDVFTPGDLGLPVANLSGLRIGALICYDLRFPEAVRISSLQGADLIVVPTAWVGGFDPRSPGLEDIGQVKTLRVMANLNAVPIACASQVGHSGPFTFLGSSVAVDSFGNDLALPASRTERDLVLVDIDLDIRARARNRGAGMSPITQRRTDVYEALLGYVPAHHERPKPKENR